MPVWSDAFRIRSAETRSWQVDVFSCGELDAANVHTQRDHRGSSLTPRVLGH